MPSASFDADASKLTVSGAIPVKGDAVNDATGGWLTGGGEFVTEISRTTVAVAPSSSVTVRRAENVPAVA